MVSQDIAKEVKRLVKVVRETLDNPSQLYVIVSKWGNFPAEPMSCREKNAPSTSRMLASDKDVYVSEPPSSKYSEHAFDTWRELHHPGVCEAISRPITNSRPWTAGKRELPSDDELKVEGEVYLELMGSDSTLVDVDRALSNAHSEWFT
jgi:hypothetical protein